MYVFVKRLLDIILSLVLLVCTSWLILLSALCIKLEEPHGPVFFTQKRVGKHHRVFSIFKLRTMRAGASDGKHRPTGENITRCGRVLRKLSIDELPQLCNILFGQMSFIGPRPMPVQYLPYFTVTEDIRHSVRPGVTGLAQLSGRANLGWDERFAYDVEYVEHLSFRNDCKIFFRTFAKVLKSENVVSGLKKNFDEYRKSAVEEGLLKKENLLLYAHKELFGLGGVENFVR